MKYVATVYVSLQNGYSDPEGETAAYALRGLGFPVIDIKTGKKYEITFELDEGENAKEVVDRMCRRQLSNPSRDNYTFELEELIEK